MAVKKASKGQGYACRVCGYSIVVDTACGCEEEHVLVCCDQPMKRVAAKKPAAKKAAKKK